MSYQEQTNYNYYATDHIDPGHTLAIAGTHLVTFITKVVLAIGMIVMKATYLLIEEIATIRHTRT